MTERELRNARMKERIMRDAEAYCRFIDVMEEELKDREKLNAQLATEIDKMREAGNKAA